VTLFEIDNESRTNEIEFESRVNEIEIESRANDIKGKTENNNIEGKTENNSMKSAAEVKIRAKEHTMPELINNLTPVESAYRNENEQRIVELECSQIEIDNGTNGKDYRIAAVSRIKVDIGEIEIGNANIKHDCRTIDIDDQLDMTIMHDNLQSIEQGDLNASESVFQFDRAAVQRGHIAIAAIYSNNHQLNDAITCSREEIIQMLREYGRGRHDLIMMVRDINHEDDERTIIEIDCENKTSLHELLRLELDEQKSHDLELSQLHDDVLQHINSVTDEIIANAERDDDTDSFGSSPVNVFNSDWYQEPHVSCQNPSLSLTLRATVLVVTYTS
jgi:hypothetical protein